MDDLIVKQGTYVTLDANPPHEIAGSMQRVKINNLQDLVDTGAVRSRDVLDKLLAGAQRATASVIHLRETYFPPVMVYGTTRPDLRRFSAFRAEVPEAPSADTEIFWRLARAVEPTKLAAMTPITHLGSLSSRLREIFKYQFKNVTVESNSVLTLAPVVDVFQCGNLTIQKGAKIVVQGSGIVIKASSIQGNV